jgi:ankyrin repeat protein
MWAAQAGQLETVQLLLDSGADVQATDNKANMTAVLSASARGQTQIIKILLDRGGNLHDKAREGKTALILAAFVGQRRHRSKVNREW